MVTRVQDVRPSSTSDRFMQAFPNVGNSLGKSYAEHKMSQEQKRLEKEKMDLSNQAIKGLTGSDISGLTGKDREAYLEYITKGQLEGKKIGFEKELESHKHGLKSQETAAKLAGEKNEKIAPYQNALKTIDRMEFLGAKGGMGRGSSWRAVLGGAQAKDFGEYQQLGKSLISFASTIPIRNEKEFDILSANLFDPTIPDSKRSGILKGMRKIINDAMNSEGIPTEQNSNPPENKPVRNIKSFYE